MDCRVKRGNDGSDIRVSSFMPETLIADIGATNSRLAMIGPDGRPAKMLKYRGDEVASLEAAIARYMEEAGVRAQAAVLAIAAPVEGDAVTMTNRAWSFRLSEVAKRFGWRAIRGLNDFEALAWGLERLAREDVRALGPAMPAAEGVRVVFGPGTGLGVAALVPGASGTRVVPTEGGHASFGPASDEEEPIFSRLRTECGAVSAEMVLAGPGLERLHRAMHGSDGKLSAASIVAAAHRADAAAGATVAMFVRLLGRFAGDLALMFRAMGGIYLGGGVARRIGPLLEASSFRAAFENHPPYAHLLKSIPTTLITFDEPGLLGCAALAQRLVEQNERGAGTDGV
jgi:glucokinase